MTTKIYKSYSDFLERDNKDENGVSEDFAKLNPNYEKQNIENKGCYDCSRCYDCSGCSRCYDCSGCSDCSGCYDCSGCSGCSDCSGCSGCSDCYDCSGCSGCSDCYDCSGCSGCSDCYDCSGCYDCSDKKEENILLNPPKIKNIHNAILVAVSKENALDMSKWHTCDTTHCRAGWAVTLAGVKGKELEKKTSTLFAAMMIYKASSSIKVSPPRFFENNEQAMADIKRCAELEMSNDQS